MKDQNVQVRKETYCRLYDRVWNISHKCWNQWYIHNIFAKEEYQELSEDIGNNVSPDPLYRGLATLLDWSLSRLASNGLICYSSTIVI